MNNTKTKEIKIEGLSINELRQIALEMRSKPLTKDNLDYLRVVNEEMRTMLKEINNFKYEESKRYNFPYGFKLFLSIIKNIFKSKTTI